MLSDAVRQELRSRSDGLAKRIALNLEKRSTVELELAGLTSAIESDQEMRELIQKRLDDDTTERRAASQNDMLS